MTAGLAKHRAPFRGTDTVEVEDEPFRSDVLQSGIMADRFHYPGPGRAKA